MVKRQLVFVAIIVAALLALAGCANKSSTTTSETATPSPTAAAGKKHSEMSAEELEKWQKDLNSVGCWAGPVDGKLGPETEHAIKEFQKAEGLTVDGLFGPNTESKLGEAAKAGKKVCADYKHPTHSPAPTHTSTAAGPNPPCTMDALSAAAKAHHGASFRQMHAFECAQPWATANVSVADGSTSIDVTDLYKAKGTTAWEWVDRTEPCAKKEVPQPIYSKACESN